MVLASKKFGRVLRQLMPPGRLFTERPDSVLERLLEGLAGEFERVDTMAARLPIETDPSSTSLFLTEWERVLDLPDRCQPAPTTTVERRAAVVGRYLSGGSLSRPFFIQLAGALGYEITIDEGANAQFVVGVSAVGDALGPDGGAFIWTVIAPAGVRQYFRAGGSVTGDPLASSADELLECVIERAAPAHTAVRFVYVEPSVCWVNVLDENGTELRVGRVDDVWQVFNEFGIPLDIPLNGGELRVLDENGTELTITLEGACTP